MSEDEEVTLLNRRGEAKLKVSAIRQFALTDGESIRTDFIRLMPAASKAAADALMSRRWLALVAEPPSFITSDDPVVLLRGSCRRQIRFRNSRNNRQFCCFALAVPHSR